MPEGDFHPSVQCYYLCARRRTGCRLQPARGPQARIFFREFVQAGKGPGFARTRGLKRASNG